MKKLLLSVYLLSVIGFYGYSQSLSLSNIHGTIEPNSIIIQAGTPDSVELITYFNVKNISAKTINVLCKKVQCSMLDSTEITMCWAGSCYPSSTFVSPNAQAITAGQTITDFIGHYTQTAYLHFKSGESVVRWVFFDKINPNDSVSVTIKYATFPLAIEESAARRAMLSNAYPNPSASETSFSYSIPVGSQGTILVRDLLGSTVQSLVLPVSFGKTTLNTMNLSDGIYFCSLMVDGKVNQTKKIVVKH